MESGGGFCRDYHPSSLVEDLDRQHLLCDPSDCMCLVNNQILLVCE